MGIVMIDRREMDEGVIGDFNDKLKEPVEANAECGDHFHVIYTPGFSEENFPITDR